MNSYKNLNMSENEDNNCLKNQGNNVDLFCISYLCYDLFSLIHSNDY